MNRATSRIAAFSHLGRPPALLLVLLSSLFISSVKAQTGRSAQSLTPEAVSATSAAPNEKAEKILQRAIGVLGGERYLNVRSVIGRGLYTQFKDGASGVPSTFVDYLIYPDKERTEFRSGGVRVIQTNYGDSGWIYDGAARTLRDMQPAQIEDFRIAMRSSLENLLRGWWRKEKAQLSYVGRREAGLARRNETVSLTYGDGFTVEYEFGAKDGLPAKVIYKRKNAQDEDVMEEDRFAQFITNDGIVAPFIIDHYRAGAQTSRINYESIEFNRPIPETIFQKPADVKALK